MKGSCKRMRIIQKGLLKANEARTIEFGGIFVATCYHIGYYDNILETYNKILEWIERHGYEAEDDCYERYVVDYWTSKDSNNYVTEVMIKIKS